MQELIERKEWDNLIQSDQLTRERRAGRVFRGFNEGAIAFPPTYVPPPTATAPVAQPLANRARSPHRLGASGTRWELTTLAT